jgi:hypothetical protein
MSVSPVSIHFLSDAKSCTTGVLAEMSGLYYSDHSCLCAELVLTHARNTDQSLYSPPLSSYRSEY